MISDEQAIRSVIDTWLRASAASDVSTMLTLLAEDMVFIVPGQPPFGKVEFRAAWDGPMKGAKIATEAGVEENWSVAILPALARGCRLLSPRRTASLRGPRVTR